MDKKQGNKRLSGVVHNFNIPYGNYTYQKYIYLFFCLRRGKTNAAEPHENKKLDVLTLKV